jgi:tetratricopeptide (TPR) repeat protein
MTRRVAAFFASLMLVVSLSGAALGQAPGPEATARARKAYALGQELFRKGDFTAALSSFEQAYQAVPNPVVLLSIAECQVRQGSYEAAVASLDRYLTERPQAPDRAQVEAQIGKLREKPAFVTVESTPPGAAIFVDDVDTGKKSPADLELKPGTHAIELRVEGFKPDRRDVTLPIGGRETLSIVLDLDRPPPPTPVAEPTPPPAPTEEQDSAATRKAIWVATGLAAAGLVTGGVLGGLALKSKKDFDDAPSEAKADKGERLALFADVGFGVAVAAGVTALVLALTDSKKTESETARVQLAPALSRDAAGAVGIVAF